MMERVRILLVATPTAAVRSLAARLQDPDLDVVTCGSAQEVLDRLGQATPNIVVLDGSLPGRDIFRLYGRLRGQDPNLPIIFSGHARSSADPAVTTSPDFYLGPEASIDEIEQILFTFLPESLVEEEPPAEPVRESVREPQPEPPPRPPAGRVESPPRPPAPPQKPASSAGLSFGDMASRLQTAPTLVALAYLAVYATGEVLAAGLDFRLGLVVHAGLLLAVFLHGANIPPGPERTFFWTLWLAPLTRIYQLAQPYAGAPPLIWWALTAVPMAVAGIVAMRLTGLNAREAGLAPTPRELPIALFMAPVGLALGMLLYLLVEPRSVVSDLPFGGLGLAVLAVVVNPGIVDEVVFRGVLQKGVSGVFGSGLGLLYASILYAAITPAGTLPGPSVLSLTVTFGLGALLAAITARTGSILSSGVLHASLALSMYVVGPYLVPGAAGPPLTTPVVTPTADLRTATTKPTVAVSPAPAGPASPAAAQPSPALAAPASPTPITLAPPLVPPPTLAVPSQGSPPPAAPTETRAGATPGQIVVVRGTGGAGARLRSQPGASAPTLAIIAEYTPLVVVGQDRIVDGTVWRNVRAPSGVEGWIAASFVTTGQETPPVGAT